MKNDMNTFKIGDKVLWMRPKQRGWPIEAVFMGYVGKNNQSAVINTKYQRTTVRVKSLRRLACPWV